MLPTVFKKCMQFLVKVPGREKFGFYRFCPYFFIIGAALEYTMIHWRPRGHNFYDTYLRNEAKWEAIEQLKILGELDPSVEDI